MRSGQHLLRVGIQDVPQVWPMVADMIDNAYAELDEVTPDVLPWLLADKGTLWVLSDGEKVIGAATTSFVMRRGGKALLVVACGGYQGDWVGSLAEIEDYAWLEGCYKVSFNG